ncbi:MAG: signal peptidase I [Bryobacteraceae bacterium]
MQRLIQSIRKTSPRHPIAEWAATFVIMLWISTSIGWSFVVPTGSMENTILIGDHLVVDKLAYAPAGPISKHLLPYQDVKRGDIIVFRYPLDLNQNFVKRVIGVPGDRVRLSAKTVYLNGKPLDEPYKVHVTQYLDSYRDYFPAAPNGPVDQRALTMLAEHVKDGELVVPPGQYFAMGDNRDNSLDSRYWGLVPRENIVGKPVVIFWSYDAPTADWTPFNPAHWLDVGLNFFNKTRWNRMGRLIRAYPIG